MTAFSWKNLQAELSTSSYLDASDDLSTQRGLIAAAIPIADRMSNSEEMREVTWKPVRLSLKSNEVTLESTKDPSRWTIADYTAYMIDIETDMSDVSWKPLQTTLLASPYLGYFKNF